MTAYYNEIDEEAADVLRTLIADDVIAPGDVDTRSIKDVMPDDLRGYDQCHFFAGGGLWSVAARLAGWADDRPLWTGSCPCQPFSQAGKRLGTDDPRHLWPDFHRLISASRPVAVVGEQVAGQAGRNWFHGVRTDLAGSGYAGRAVDIPACAVDSPQQRQRLYWLALADTAGAGSHASTHVGVHRREEGAGARYGEPERLHGADCQVVDPSRIGRREGRAEPELRRRWPAPAFADVPGLEVAGADSRGEPRRGILRPGESAGAHSQRSHGQSRRPNGSWWADAEWLACHDGKLRRTKPGLPLLVDGLHGRVGLWRIAGNAISPILAAEVIGALMDIMEDQT